MLGEINYTSSQRLEPTDWFSDGRVVIYPLLFCPPLKKGSRYCLVRRDEMGSRALLGTGVAVNSHPPLNLAHVRQRCAKLAANEVFVIESPRMRS